MAPSRWGQPDVVDLPAGSGVGALGVVAGREDEAPAGPRAILATPQGLLILDNENGRLLALRRGNIRGPSSEVPLEGARGIDHLMEVGGLPAAVDAARGSLLMIDVEGRRTVRRSLGAPDLGPLRRRADGRWSTTDAQGREHLIEPGGAGDPLPHLGPPVPPQPSVRVRMEGGRAEYVRGSGQVPRPIQPVVAGEVVSVAVLGRDRAGRVYVRLEVATGDAPLRVRRFIHVLQPSGAVLDVFEYPTAGVIVPDQDVAVDEEGTVSVLLPRPEGTAIWRFGSPTS